MQVNQLQRRLSQFGKYCVVGIVGVFVNLGIYTALVNFARLNYMAGATVSFAVAVTNNFLLNKYWTFGNPEGSGFTQAGRFLVVSLLSLLLNLLVLRLLVEDAGVGNLPAQMIAISVVTVLNYLGNKKWSFRQTPA